MKVYSLLGFWDYEGSELVGVFESVEDVLECVKKDDNEWYYDSMGYVESELGEKVMSMGLEVEYVKFKRYSYGNVVDKS